VPTWPGTIATLLLAIAIDVVTLARTLDLQDARCGDDALSTVVYGAGVAIVIGLSAAYVAWRAHVHADDGDRAQIARLVLAVALAAGLGALIANVVILAQAVPASRVCVGAT
jgi:hypothetical protein